MLAVLATDARGKLAVAPCTQMLTVLATDARGKLAVAPCTQMLAVLATDARGKLAVAPASDASGKLVVALPARSAKCYKLPATTWPLNYRVRFFGESSDARKNVRTFGEQAMRTKTHIRIFGESSDAKKN